VIRVRPQRITSENIAGLGSALTAPSHVPTSQGVEYKFWSDLVHFLIPGETEVGLCTVSRQPTSEISGLERHVRTPEILIPVDAPFVLPLLKEGKSEEEYYAYLAKRGIKIGN